MDIQSLTNNIFIFSLIITLINFVFLCYLKYSLRARKKLMAEMAEIEANYEKREEYNQYMYNKINTLMEENERLIKDKACLMEENERLKKKYNKI